MKITGPTSQTPLASVPWLLNSINHILLPPRKERKKQVFIFQSLGHNYDHEVILIVTEYASKNSHAPSNDPFYTLF